MVLRVCCFIDCFTSQKLKHVLKLTFDLYANPHEHIDFVDENEPYTHVVLFNDVMPNLPTTIPKENVIGISYEPNAYHTMMQRLTHPRFIDYVKRRVSMYFIPDRHPKLTHPQFRAHYTFLTTDCAFAENNMHTPKPNVMSFIVSHKTFLPGHKYRHALLDAIMKTNLPIDIWGQGSLRYAKDPRCKGPFLPEDNHTPYDSYKFHLAIENSREAFYVSEKYTRPLLNGCIPVYLGSPNIQNIFGESCCIQLSGSIEADIAMLTDIVNNPSKYELDTSYAFNQLWKKGKAYLPDFLQAIWLDGKDTAFEDFRKSMLADNHRRTAIL